MVAKATILLDAENDAKLMDEKGCLCCLRAKERRIADPRGRGRIGVVGRDSKVLSRESDIRESRE